MLLNSSFVIRRKPTLVAASGSYKPAVDELQGAAILPLDYESNQAKEGGSDTIETGMR
jgi:hypothetical protein